MYSGFHTDVASGWPRCTIHLSATCAALTLWVAATACTSGTESTEPWRQLLPLGPPQSGLYAMYVIPSFLQYAIVSSSW